MKFTKLLTLFLFFLSCKENKEINSHSISKDSIAISTTKVDNSNTITNIEFGDKTTNSKNTDCYDYLTELVRSSNFPFSEWDVPKEKVNLIIDEHNNQFIRAKLAYETEGTGTIGWIEYSLNNGILKNTSADLEKPKNLKYDKIWKAKFDECNYTNNYEKSSTIELLDLSKIYKTCKILETPFKYSYEFISELPNFTKISDDVRSMFQLEHLQNLQQINLTSKGDIKPVLISGYLDSGETELYMVLLDGSYKYKEKVLLYGSEEIDGAESLSTTFEISENFEIKVDKNKTSGNGENKTTRFNLYKINSNGTFLKIK